jgi:hypothetical protein
LPFRKPLFEPQRTRRETKEKHRHRPTRFFLVLPPGAVYKALNTILQVNNIEVYKQSQGFATQFDVQKNMGVMYWCDGVHRLQCNDDQVFNEQVDAITEFELDSAVEDWRADLGFGADCSSVGGLGRCSPATRGLVRNELSLRR